jgi:hypothetical protein
LKKRLRAGCKGGIKWNVFWESTDPLESRQQLIKRKFQIIAVLGSTFVLVIILSSAFAVLLFSLPASFLVMLAVDAICMGIAGYLYILWKERPILIKCPKCGEIISSHTPWLCKACGTANRNVQEFPFLHKCGNAECGVGPKTYRCHHCKEFVYLTEDEDEINYASCLNSPAEQPEPDEHLKKVKALQQEKERKLEEREIVGLDEDLATIRAKIRALEKPKQTGPEAVRSKVKQKVEMEMEGEKLKVYYAKKYKGKKAILDRICALIDAEILRPRIDED